MKTHLLLKKYVTKRKISLRSLAAELELSPSFLSRVMSGAKPIPYALLLRLIDALDIEPEIASTLKNSHSVQLEDLKAPRKGPAEVQTSLQEWELAETPDFNILRQWFYLALLDITTLTNFDGTTKMMAQRLGLSLTATEIAVRELLAKGLLVEEKGRLRKTRKKLRWGSAQALNDIRHFHDQMLEKAQIELRQATSQEEFSRRLIMGITVTASERKIEAAKKKLSECLHEIANDLIQETGDEVYHLSGQFFPLTKGTRSSS